MATSYDKIIRVPLKRKPAGAAACPDEDRCQLEVLRPDPSEAIQITTADDGSKLVRVAIIKEGSGCDYKVRVGLVSAPGIIAMGYGSVDWEVTIGACTDRDPVWMPVRPIYMLQEVRECNGAPVTLFCIQHDTASGIAWTVIVKRGKDVFSKSFTSDHDLQVSAALSSDCCKLYIVESVVNVDEQAAYTVYTWVDGAWALTSADIVPHPGAPAEPKYHRYVNNLGQIGGSWGFDTTGVPTQVRSGTCGVNNYFEDVYHTASYFNHTGDLYDVNTLSFVPYTGKVYGAAIGNNGDRCLVAGIPQNTGEYINSRMTREVDTSKTPMVGFQEEFIDSKRNYEVWVAGAVVGTEEIYGRYLDYKVTQVINNISTPPTPQWPYYTYNYTHSQDIDRFDDRTGSILISVKGGWVIRTRSEFVVSLVDSSYYSEGFGTATMTCPEITAVDDLVNAPSNRVTTNVLEQSTVWPKTVAHHAMTRGFCCYNHITGEDICGCYVSHSAGGEFAWHIFKNGVDVTAAITNCLMQPIADLRAIYFEG